MSIAIHGTPRRIRMPMWGSTSSLAVFARGANPLLEFGVECSDVLVAGDVPVAGAGALDTLRTLRGWGGAVATPAVGLELLPAGGSAGRQEPGFVQVEFDPARDAARRCVGYFILNCSAWASRTLNACWLKPVLVTYAASKASIHSLGRALAFVSSL